MTVARALAAAAVIAAAAAAPAVAAPVWLPPATLAVPSPGTGAPALASEASGRAVAAWTRRGEVRMALRAPGGPWYLPRPVPGSRGVVAGDVQVAVGPDGTAVIGWSAGGRALVALRPAGRRLSRPVALSRPGRVATAPRCGVAADGEAVCAWLSEPQGGGPPAIEAAARPPGARWEAPVTLSAAGEAAFGPALAVGAGGEAVAVWRHDVGDQHLVRAAARDAAGGWGSPADLSAPGESVFVDPAAAVGPRGEALVVWTLARGGTVAAQTAARAPGGSWSMPEDLSRPGRDVRGARVAIDASGGAVAVWAREGVVQAAARPAGGGWRPPRDLSETSWVAGGPEVAANARGDAVVTWSAVQGTRFAVQAAARPADGDFSDPATLSEEGERAALPSGGIDARGGLVAAWRTTLASDPDLAPSGVRAASGVVSAPPAERPALLDLRPRPARFRPPGATSLLFGLTAPAPVRVAVRRAGSERVVGAVTIQGRAGLNRIRLAARIGGRALGPGRYLVSIGVPGGAARTAGVVILPRRR